MPNVHKAEAHSQSCKTSKMKIFAKIVNGWKPLTIIAKGFILGAWQGSEYTPVKLTMNL